MGKYFDAYQYIFGAEESYGSLFGTFVRDKDAVSAACLVAEVAALAKKQNLTLVDRLYQIYRSMGASIANRSPTSPSAIAKQGWIR